MRYPPTRPRHGSQWTPVASAACGPICAQQAVLKVAKAHARVADTRRDHHHKLSTRIIAENQGVYVEDLAVNGLGRTWLAKSVHDAGWSQFGTDCGSVHDRDLNAARNVLTLGKQLVAAGQAETRNACGAQIRPGAIPAQRSEAGIRRGDRKRGTRANDAVGVPAQMGREDVKYPPRRVGAHLRLNSLLTVPADRAT